MKDSKQQKPAYTRRQQSSLAAWRVSTGLSLEAISKRLGVSRITWIRWERTGRYPNRYYPTLKRIGEDMAVAREEAHATG